MSQTHKKTASTATSTTTIPTTELRKRSRRLVVLILHSRTKGHDKNGGTPPLFGVYIWSRNEGGRTAEASEGRVGERMRFTWSVVAQRLHAISTTYYVLDVVVVGTTSMYHSRSHSIASTGDGTKEYYGEEESLLPLCEKLHTELRRRTIVYN